MTIRLTGHDLTDAGSFSPRRLLQLYVAAFVCVWTLVPSFVHVGLPLDLVEGYALGHEAVIGYYKHPSMPWWLVEATRRLTGAVGWPAYLLSALLVATTMWLAFLLGRDMMDERRAAVGALLLSGVMYFSWVVPEFNHNVVQMPLWMAFILALWRARERGGWIWWGLAGLAGAVGFYAKLANVVIVGTGLLYMACDPKLRRAWRTPGPWLMLAVLAITMIPLIVWLIESRFLPFEYAKIRSRGNRAGGMLLFMLKQAASAGGLMALLAIAVLPHRPATEHTGARIGPVPDALRFLLFFLAVPLLLLIVAALLSRSGLKGSWGTPMLSLAGLLAVTLTWARIDAVALRRVAFGAGVLLVVVPVAYAIVTLQPSGRPFTPKRTSWPQAEVAAEMQRIWRAETGLPLRIVAGDLWAAGMVAAHASDRPSVLIEGSRPWSPWIMRQRLEREGMMLIWWRARENPPDDLRPWVGIRIDGERQFRMGNGDRGEIATVHYTIVKPGTVRWPQ